MCERLLDRGETGIVCGRCWARLPALPSPKCDRCGHPTYAEACRWCELLPPYVRAARSVCWAAGETGLGVVHALKYQGWYRVAAEMAARMSRLDWPADVVEERAALVPVPLSAKRERQRGYNQTLHLARELARRWSLPVWDTRARAHAPYRDADAVDTRGPTPQRFGRVFRARIRAKRAARRARHRRGRRRDDCRHPERVRCRALRWRRTHC